ncbi:MAG: tRNA pseudouridine(55) synthase TruB [Acidaminococcaceae bacterium]|nr:tRNA pseudouridine(55) synthase TruB [Acidaminococcaceae bacterium]
MMDGIFNVLKPPGMTSHDVVSVMRRILHTKKIGHGGTLDPMAAGVLPVFVGKATRLLEYALEGSKAYRAVITFGSQTDTGDEEGKLIATSDIVALSKEAIIIGLQSFEGEGKQIPPMYSAISYQGQKLYKLARQGVEIEREPRTICIHSLKMVDYTGKQLIVDVECSKGTFIRTLSEDIAQYFGMVGTMSFLLRYRVGDFPLSTACTLEEIEEDYEQCILPMELAIKHLPIMEVSTWQGLRIAQGVATTVSDIQEGKYYKLVTNEGLMIGVAFAKDGRLRAHKIINIPQKEEAGIYEDDNQC